MSFFNLIADLTPISIILTKFVMRTLDNHYTVSFHYTSKFIFMLLIADSGATKTDWCLVKSDSSFIHFQTIGLNPYTTSFDDITQTIRSLVLPQTKEETIKHLYFYGAGCGSEEKKTFIRQAFQLFFSETEVEINHDLMGACKALCGNNKGIVGILGTGSNSGLYNGSDIIENVPSLGYVLSDEGSGAVIGKHILRLYLRQELPLELQEAFHAQYPGNENDFLDTLYKKPFPNRYLASFTHFVYQHRQHPYIETLLKLLFQDFFVHQICKYTDYSRNKLFLIGSVAFYFQDLLQETGTRYNISLEKVIKAPLDELVAYHCKMQS